VNGGGHYSGLRQHVFLARCFDQYVDLRTQLSFIRNIRIRDLGNDQELCLFKQRLLAKREFFLVAEESQLF